MITFFIVGCESESLEKKINDMGDTPQEIIAAVNEQYGDERNYGVSIYDDKIVASNNTETVEIDLSEEMFYMAIAPYYETTHNCSIHSATGCGGELRNEEFNVKIISDQGEVVFDDQVKSMQNGFFEIWLPRDITGSMTITHGEAINVSSISTFAGDNTCVTTTQLSYES
jgi:hypothetical protein